MLARCVACISAVTLLSGCSAFLPPPVGSVGLCIGVCRIEMQAPPAPTAAEKAAGGLFQLGAEFLANKDK
jgi:hypothetical protein